ncbi:uncharacterized protein F5147DRAFT_778368 [Suillus discolor]|uniref:Uncharacterized protein n=1 Tax=Suillus discolor TaxID=1912936 RepID=A0A9P7JPM8_9AGAM|nr:uncharacterized protein F5147DRAFT_778368 [Suillus discolor]KAG2096317.1 hypothetical protein F5147DRAFT_778368 [Suillus discolor]
MFFHGMEAPQPSPMDSLHPHSSANAFLAHLFSLLCGFLPVNDETTELPQPSWPLAVHLRTLLTRLSLLIHRFSPESDAPNELQQPSTSSQSRTSSNNAFEFTSGWKVHQLALLTLPLSTSHQ